MDFAIGIDTWEGKILEEELNECVRGEMNVFLMLKLVEASTWMCTRFGRLALATLERNMCK